MKVKNFFQNTNDNVIAALSIFLILIALIFRQSLYGIFGVENYLTIHLIVEIFIISTSLTISFQSWTVFPHILTSYRLWIGSLFFSISLLEIAHTITFKGMPFFLSESSTYKATWFFIVSRLTEVIGVLVIAVTKNRMVAANKRWFAYIIAFLYSATWIIAIYFPTQLFPELVHDGVGTTTLKNDLEYGCIFIEVLVIYFLFVHFRSHGALYLMLIAASIYMIIADYFFTHYKSVYDINNFIGHWFQLAGFYFLQRGVYKSSVEEPFQKQKEAEEQLRENDRLLQFMAFHDELTELPNFRFLQEKWTEVINQVYPKKAAILILDIERFSKINEALGHPFGDLILKEIAIRVKGQLSTDMVIGRITGDEFCLIIPAVHDYEDAVTVINKILKSFKAPIQAQNLNINVNLSIGAALYPVNGSSFEELLHFANMALVEAQQQNHSYEFYQSSLNGKALDRLVLENDLFHALSRNELYVVYQPQVNIFSEKIIGLEALIRWNHPQKGVISPDKFIPIAEETGLIIPIGEWVIRTACKQIKELHDNGFSSLIVAVNLSIRQFYQQNLAAVVKEILSETNLAPCFLELEITESMMMNVEHAMSTLLDLKHLGVSIAIDDFGTGYSSLSYLKNLPVDRLKIDQSFVRELLDNKKDLTMISMIISLAKHMNLEVIAEGVETIKQKEILQSEHCQQVQGFLYSPPLLPEELFKMLDEIQRRSGNIIYKETAGNK